MSDADFEFVPDHPDWHPVLQAYLQAQDSLLQERRTTLTSTKCGPLSMPHAGDDVAEAPMSDHLRIASDESDDGNSEEFDCDSDLRADDEPHTDDGDRSSDDDCGRRAQGRLNGTPWVTRLRAVEGVASVELSRVHGQLIAFGFLKCDVQDRDQGAIYQVTPDGRLALVKFDRKFDRPDACNTSTDGIETAADLTASIGEQALATTASVASTSVDDTGCDQSVETGDEPWSLLPPDGSSSLGSDSVAAA